MAAQAGSVGCLEELIDQAQVDPQRADHDGMTPVHYAALAGKLQLGHVNSAVAHSKNSTRIPGPILGSA